METNRKLIYSSVFLLAVLAGLFTLLGFAGVRLSQNSHAKLKHIEETALEPTLALQEVRLLLKDLEVEGDKVFLTDEAAPLKIGAIIEKVNLILATQLRAARKTSFEKALYQFQADWRIVSEHLVHDLKGGQLSTARDFHDKLTILNDSITNITGLIQNNVKYLVAESKIYATKSANRLLFAAILGLILGFFVSVVVLIYVKKLIQQITETKKDRETLLDNLDQGFMVIDKSGRILPGSSRAAHKLFGTDPTRKNLIELLQLEDKEGDVAHQWLKELFIDSNFSISDFLKLGPNQFDKVEDRVVELEYRPIWKSNGKTLDKIICIATDKTTEKQLETKAEEERALAQILISVLNDKDGFADFVNEMRFHFKSIFHELNKLPNDCDIEKIYRHLHTIKGASTQFHLTKIGRLAGSVENTLEQYRTVGRQRKLDLESLRRRFWRLESTFEGFLRKNEKYFGRFDEKGNFSRNYPLEVVFKALKRIRESCGQESEVYREFLGDFLLGDPAVDFRRYSLMVSRLGKSESKDVVLLVRPCDFKVYTPFYRSLFASFVHAFRNSIDHGIELPDERAALGKPNIGRIEICIEQKDSNTLRIKVSDDGRGIDTAKIKQKALAKKLTTEGELNKYSEHEIMQFVFHENFSTKDELSELSGRGVGLDVIKHEATLIGGSAHIESQPQRGTALIVEVPLVQEPKEIVQTAAHKTKAA